MPIFSKKITPTSITSDIERATSPEQQELDWGLVVQISEAVNNTELGAKEARKLLQKKSVSNNAQTQALSLQLLKALSEASPQKFHDQLIAKSFIDDLNKLAFYKNLEPQAHGALIDALRSWASQYRQDPSMDELIRIHDKLTADPAGPRVRPSRRERTGTQESSAPREEDIPGDIELARNNCQVLAQTLSFTDPGKEDISKNELIQEFYGKCKDLHMTIMRHLQTASDPDVISTLLDTNSELVNTFKAYDDMLEQSALQNAKSASTNNDVTADSEGTTQQQTAPATHEAGSGENRGENHGLSAPENETLIDFNTPTREYPPSYTGQGQQTSISGDPFDPFSDDSQVNEPQSSVQTGTNLPPPLQPRRAE